MLVYPRRVITQILFFVITRAACTAVFSIAMNSTLSDRKRLMAYMLAGADPFQGLATKLFKGFFGWSEYGKHISACLTDFWVMAVALSAVGAVFGDVTLAANRCDTDACILTLWECVWLGICFLLSVYIFSIYRTPVELLSRHAFSEAAGTATGYDFADIMRYYTTRMMAVPTPSTFKDGTDQSSEPYTNEEGMAHFAIAPAGPQQGWLTPDTFVVSKTVTGERVCGTNNTHQSVVHGSDDSQTLQNTQGLSAGQFNTILAHYQQDGKSDEDDNFRSENPQIFKSSNQFESGFSRQLTSANQSTVRSLNVLESGFSRHHTSASRAKTILPQRYEDLADPDHVDDPTVDIPEHDEIVKCPKKVDTGAARLTCLETVCREPTVLKIHGKNYSLLMCRYNATFYKSYIYFPNNFAYVMKRGFGIRHVYSDLSRNHGPFEMLIADFVLFFRFITDAPLRDFMIVTSLNPKVDPGSFKACGCTSCQIMYAKRPDNFIWYMLTRPLVIFTTTFYMLYVAIYLTMPANLRPYSSADTETFNINKILFQALFFFVTRGACFSI
ncbi:hypothetical protein HDV05_008237, partial [Chytridiales sp. JEL 0842]